MRTLFDFELEADPRIIVDRRAKQRGKGSPAFTDVRWIESYGEALNRADSFNPTAIVKDDGSCLLYGCGGSGLVWVCTNDGSVTDTQQEMIDLVVTHLMYLGAVIQGSDTLRYFDIDTMSS